MKERLTINLDERLVEKAQAYAKENNISLSKLVESYLNVLTKEKHNQPEITPLVKSLSGVIELPSDYNEKESYKDYLSEKNG